MAERVKPVPNAPVDRVFRLTAIFFAASNRPPPMDRENLSDALLILSIAEVMVTLAAAQAGHPKDLKAAGVHNNRENVFAVEIIREAVFGLFLQY